MPAPPRTSLRVVIVSYRSAGLVIDCLASLAPEVAALPDCKVVIVENASGDDSLARIGGAIAARGWGDWVELVASPRNGGFAAGNNVALRRLLASPRPPDHVLLLNPDTLVHPGALGAMLAFIEARPEVGIVGCRLEFPDGTPQYSAFNFPTVLSEIERGFRMGPVTRALRAHMVAPPPRNEPHPADWVSGAAMLVRREVFDQVGLMDEGYFLYFEETDFCLQAHRAGFACWYLPAARVVHLEGQSTGVVVTRKVSRPMPRYWFESRARYFRKNHGALYRSLADAAWALPHVAWKARRRLLHEHDPDPPGLFSDFVRFALEDTLGRARP